VKTLPPGTALPDDAALSARRSEVYGKLGPVRIEDTQARALGFSPRSIEDGLTLTAAWITDRYASELSG
jgi:hypothetical protein